jgi:hypothetical protein
MFLRKQLKSNRGTVFSVQSEQRCYNRETFRSQFSCKVAAIQSGLEHGGRGRAIVGAVTRQLLEKTLQAGKDLACALVIC